MSCNVIGQYIDFSLKNIEKSFKIILNKYYDYDVLKKYLDRYVEVRYMGDYDSSSKMIQSLDYELFDIYKKYQTMGDNYKLFLELFEFVYYFDDVLYVKDKRKIVNKLSDIRKKRLGLDDSSFVNDFCSFWENVDKRKKDFINRFECLEFPVRFKKIFNSNIYDVSIGYNIEIPKLYSKYAIDRVFNTGIISEDKLFIQYYMVSSNILSKVIKGNFSYNYLVDFNVDLVLKKEKFNRLINILDNDVCRDMVSFKVSYEKFILFKNDIYNLIKKGYKFSIVIDDTFVEKNLNLLDVFEYILLDKKSLFVDKFNKYNNVILI